MHQADGDKENPSQLVISKAIDRICKARPDVLGPLKPRNALSPPPPARGSKLYMYSSPVTELAANFDELSGLNGTPRRRLSLSSLGTPTPVREVKQQPRRIADQSGSEAAADGAGEVETAEVGLSKGHSEEAGWSSFRKIKSLPVLCRQISYHCDGLTNCQLQTCLQYAFNDSPMLVADLPTFQLGSPDLPTSSQSAATRQWSEHAAGGRSSPVRLIDVRTVLPCRAEESEPVAQLAAARPRPPSAASDDSSWSQSSQDSQDSGIGKLPRLPSAHGWRRPKPVLIGRSYSDNAGGEVDCCSSPHRVASLPNLGNSPALSDILEDSAVDNSPLLKSKLCVDDDDEDICSDGGFHDGCPPEDEASVAQKEQLAIPRALSGLFTAPMVHRAAIGSSKNLVAADKAAAAVAAAASIADNPPETSATVVPEAAPSIAAPVAARVLTGASPPPHHRRSLFRRATVCSLVGLGHSDRVASEPGQDVSPFELRRRHAVDGCSERPKRPGPCSSSAPDESTTPASRKRRRAADGDDCAAIASCHNGGAACRQEQLLSPPPAIGAAAQQQRSSGSGKTLQRCQSMFEHHSLSIRLSESDPAAGLTGDLETPCCLPLIKGKHADLKSISPSTLASVLRHEYTHIVESVHIVDCRYPYEFDGGHITGALNIYCKDDLMEKFLSKPPPVQRVSAGAKRQIIVFHCEFSSERGPRLSRFLRNLDRQRNNECYPNLFYPELYLLEGGYKAFFEEFQELCVPQAYKPMLHPDHASDLRLFRCKSKSSVGGDEERQRRAGLRLGSKS